jgi:hypothetical protein
MSRDDVKHMFFINEIESFKTSDLELKLQKDILKNEKKRSKLKEKNLTSEVQDSNLEA